MIWSWELAQTHLNAGAQCLHSDVTDCQPFYFQIMDVCCSPLTVMGKVPKYKKEGGRDHPDHQQSLWLHCG